MLQQRPFGAVAYYDKSRPRCIETEGEREEIDVITTQRILKAIISFDLFKGDYLFSGNRARLSLIILFMLLINSF